MKRVVAMTLVAALLGFGGVAQAAKVWDDMSWWGNTGATPMPTEDTKGRSGYWWWPTEPASNAGDAELWGNRGIVYHAWEKPAPPPPPPPPAPPAPPAPIVKHEWPVLNEVLFDFDKSVLKPEGKTAVGQVVDVMKKYPKDTVLVEGHTDSVGADDYNMGLGQRRADSVKCFMVENGIDAGRISTKSLGESQPAVPNDTREQRALNRRAMFKATIVN